MDILGRGESGCKGPGGAHRPACARQTHMDGWGDEAKVERAPVDKQGNVFIIHTVFICLLCFSHRYSVCPKRSGSDGKESNCNVGDLGSIPGSGRSPGEGNGNSLQYSCLESPKDRRTWRAKVHGVAKSQT